MVWHDLAPWQRAISVFMSVMLYAGEQITVHLLFFISFLQLNWRKGFC